MSDTWPVWDRVGKFLCVYSKMGLQNAEHGLVQDIDLSALAAHPHPESHRLPRPP